MKPRPFLPISWPLPPPPGGASSSLSSTLPLTPPPPLSHCPHHTPVTISLNPRSNLSRPRLRKSPSYRSSPQHLSSCSCQQICNSNEATTIATCQGRRQRKKEGGLDLMAGWGSLIRKGLGGGGADVEWDIPTDVTGSCLDKGRAQMEYRNHPLKTTKQPTPQTSPIIPHPLKSTVFPPHKKHHPHKNRTSQTKKPPKFFFP